MQGGPSVSPVTACACSCQAQCSLFSFSSPPPRTPALSTSDPPGHPTPPQHTQATPPKVVAITYDGLPSLVRPGDQVYVGRYLACGAPEQGSLYLEVIEVRGRSVMLMSGCLDGHGDQDKMPCRGGGVGVGDEGALCGGQGCGCLT